MFKRFIKAVKDVAKKVWEFIKKLLPKKPKPKEEVVEPEPDEEGEKPAKNNGLNKAFSHVQKETMNRVKQLLNYGERLAAVKLLYEASGSSLKEAKEFCDNLQN